jgi:hypothetical protein
LGHLRLFFGHLPLSFSGHLQVLFKRFPEASNLGPGHQIGKHLVSHTGVWFFELTEANHPQKEK